MRPSRQHRVSLAVSALCTAVLAASCATHPAGDSKGQPIFQSFRQCMIANGVGAVFVGLLVKEVTGKNAAGVAAAAGTLFVAWKVCGQAHQRVTVSDERGREAVLNDPRFRAAAGPMLSIDELEVVSTKPGEDIVTRYRFGFTSPDAGRKDIPAREKFVFLAGFTNDRGQQEFKEIEFTRDFVIQQGQRRHEHAVPSDTSFNQFKPWRLRYTLEVDGRCMETEATFPIEGGVPGRAGPARPCGAQAVATAAPGGAKAAEAPRAAVAPAPAQAPPAARTPDPTLLRTVRLSPQPGGAPAGKSFAPGAAVQVLETRPVTVAGKPVPWVRIRTASGETGWTPEANLKR